MISLVNRSSDEYNSSSQNFCTLDSNSPSENDLMFALIGRQGSSDVPNSSPSGWSMVPGTTYHDVNSPDYIALWHKVAGASEPADYTWNWSSSSRVHGNMNVFYGDYDPIDPFDVVSDTVYISYNTVLRAEAMTVSSSDEGILWFGIGFHLADLAIAVPSSPFSMSSVTRKGNGNSDMYSRVGYGIWTSSGDTGDMDGSFNSSTSSKHAYALALNSAASENTRNKASCIGL